MLTPFHDDFFFNDDFFDGFFALPRRLRLLAPAAQPQWNSNGPQAQCRVTENGLELELEVPRFKKEQITVEADPATGRLVVTGKREPQGSCGSVHSAGTTTSSFQRAFSVSPRAYDLPKLTSVVEDGVLIIRIPHQPQAAPASPKVPPAARQDQSIAINEGAAPAAPAAAPAAEGAVAERLSTNFAWPPTMEVAAKTDTTPLTYTITMPPGLAHKPSVSLRVRDGKLLIVDVSYSVRSETEHSYSEHSGSFSRTFPLPTGSTTDDVSASMEGGKLIIRIKQH